MIKPKTTLFYSKPSRRPRFSYQISVWLQQSQINARPFFRLSKTGSESFSSGAHVIIVSFLDVEKFLARLLNMFSRMNLIVVAVYEKYMF